jgi:hypothetical protein
MMRFKKRLLAPVLAGAMLVGCVDLDLTNPSQRTADTFFRNRDDAYAALIATYHTIQELGVFGRWLVFADDMRSDIATSRSPWTDLANFTRTVISGYNFEVNIHLYEHNFRTIGAANQVIQRVPEIDMDATERAAFVAEAKFIRALAYYNLVTLFGGNVPLVTEPQVAGSLPASASAEAIWDQIEQDLTDAIADLPESYDDTQLGRVTSWAAKAMLGKAHLQQREWGEAIPFLRDVVDNGPYSLLPEYGDNFRADHDNNAESIFEVQFSGQPVLSQGSAGYSGPKLYGPCGPAFCDANPTEWYFDQFFTEVPTTGDPRLEHTLFWNKPGGMDVFGVPFATRYADRINDKFVKKYTQWYAGRPDEQFDNPVNFRVLRLGGVMLHLAEALNENGSPDQAKPYVDMVRARPSVGLPPLPAGLTQAQMRDRIEHEYLMELGFEADRFRYLQRQNLLTAAYLPTLIAHDPDFEVFEIGRSELLPIPTAETDINPNVQQNPGW